MREERREGLREEERGERRSDKEEEGGSQRREEMQEEGGRGARNGEGGEASRWEEENMRSRRAAIRGHGTQERAAGSPPSARLRLPARS